MIWQGVIWIGFTILYILEVRWFDHMYNECGGKRLRSELGVGDSLSSETWPSCSLGERGPRGLQSVQPLTLYGLCWKFTLPLWQCSSQSQLPYNMLSAWNTRISLVLSWIWTYRDIDRWTYKISISRYFFCRDILYRYIFITWPCLLDFWVRLTAESTSNYCNLWPYGSSKDQ